MTAIPGVQRGVDPYLEFLRAKIAIAPEDGIQGVPESAVNPLLKPHQKAIVLWAVRGGRRAIFAAFGLGKTWIQVEILRLVLLYGPVQDALGLIVLPLGVRQEFLRDGRKLGVKFTFARTTDEVRKAAAVGARFFLTNYESIRDEKIDLALFLVASLDEAAVLRSYGSKTYQAALSQFSVIRYRFVATATPSPNRYKELVHHAAFLGIMDSGQALTRFFQRDSTKANNLTLYPHKEREFWHWLASWAVFLTKPSDLGFPDDDYILPRIRIEWHEITADALAFDVDRRDGQMSLIRDASLGLGQAAAEKRDSLSARVRKMLDILANEPDEHYILWHHLEDERRAIERALPNTRSIFGTQDTDVNEQVLTDFAEGRTQYLPTKPEMSGSGCNLQRHCARAVFLGINYSFNDIIQAIHRIYRFLQDRECVVHLIYTEAEREIRREFEAKWGRHARMVENMTDILKEHGLSSAALRDLLTRTIGVERVEVSGRLFRVANNDAVLEARRTETESVGLIATSIPFANHYEYVPAYEDFGHTDDNAHFWAQMDYLTPELYRMLQPGRICCIHVKDRILFGNVTGLGFPTCDCFHEETVMHFRKHGFEKLGMITVITDVVRENNQTYRLGYSEMLRDGTKMGVGCPEYVIVLRKPQTNRTKGFADVPVTKQKADYSLARWQVDAHAPWRSSGNRQLSATEMAGYGTAALVKMYTEYSLQTIYDFQFHVKIGEELATMGALPTTFMALAPGSHREDVWHDINRMRTLNTAQSQKGRESHVCPLQFDIVDRLIIRYSNPGDLVYDPFGGLMTVPLRALLLGRRGAGSELNPQYFFDGVHYLKAAEQEMTTPDLFSFEGISVGDGPLIGESVGSKQEATDDAA